MKKIILIIAVFCIFFLSEAIANTPKNLQSPDYTISNIADTKIEVLLLNKRIDEIKKLNKDCISVSEKKILRKEVFEIKERMQELENGNFPFATIIIVLYFLIFFS